jgi:ABC-type nitrate/sulfonate/bicarbonate transport system permease component
MTGAAAPRYGRDCRSQFGGGSGHLIIAARGSLSAADRMVALLALGLTGLVLALGILQVEARLLRWRPEYQARG